MKKIDYLLKLPILKKNINKDNRPRINGSNIENGNKKSTKKSNQITFAFILGDSMVKDDDAYLLTVSINRKFFEN